MQRMNRPPTRGGSNGFTLFELLMVIAIIAITVGFTVPMLSSQMGTDAKTACLRRLTGAVTEARNQAMLTGKNMRLVFDEDGGITLVPGAGKQGSLPSGASFVSLTTLKGDAADDDGEVRENVLEVFPSGLIRPCVLVVQIEREDYSFYIPPISRAIEVADGVVDLEEFSDDT